MRIVHIVDCFIPELGYTEYYLAREQQKQGHEVQIITSDRFKNALKFSKVGSGIEEGIKVIRLQSLTEFSGYIFSPVKKLKSILIDFSPDIVHIHGALSSMALAPLLYKHNIGCKIVADVITGVVLSKGLLLAIKMTAFGVYRSTLLPMLFKKIDCFYANSEAAMDWVNENLRIPKSKICYIPLGADKEMFTFNLRERIMVRKRLKLSNQDVVAIYTGKLIQHKKLDLLLNASAPLIKNHKNFRILLVGNGPREHKMYLKKLVHKMGISSKVTFYKQVHRTELPSFYSAADFAVWPGSPSISMIEAMSTGLPLIIPRSKWTNHLLEYKNGFNFIKEDVKGLRAYIQILLEDEELRRKMGSKSRKLVKDKLNWDVIAQEYFIAYRKAMNV